MGKYPCPHFTEEKTEEFLGIWELRNFIMTTQEVTCSTLSLLFGSSCPLRLGMCIPNSLIFHPPPCSQIHLLGSANSSTPPEAFQESINFS